MSKSRKKLALGVVVLGAGAMIADRAMFGVAEPAPAAAAPAPAGRAASAKAATRPAAAEESLAIPELVFPKQIPRVESLEDIRDWFAPPATVAEAEENEADTPSTTAAPPAPASAETPFEQRYRLDAVVIIGSTRMAVVEGRWLRIGDTLGGEKARLVEVHDQAAVFEIRGEKKSLRVFQSVFTRDN